jgi:hypothetical protein
MELAPGTDGFHLEPWCRICRNDQVRTKVNDLLATRASYAMVLRALGNDDAKLHKRNRVTIDSIRNHTARHFPVPLGTHTVDRPGGLSDSSRGIGATVRDPAYRRALG